MVPISRYRMRNFADVSAKRIAISNTVTFVPVDVVQDASAGRKVPVELRSDRRSSCGISTAEKSLPSVEREGRELFFSAAAIFIAVTARITRSVRCSMEMF